MERKLDEVIAALPEARRGRIEARAQALVAEVESLDNVLGDRSDARSHNPRTAFAMLLCCTSPVLP